MISIICGIIVFISILIIIIKVRSDNLKLQNKKVTLSKIKVQKVLEERFSLLVELQNEFSKEKKFKDFSLELKTDYENDYFKLNAILNDATKDVKDFLDSKRKYKINDTINNLLLEINNKEIECNAYKKYYNDNVVILNNLINKSFTKSIAKVNNIKHLELYNDPVVVEFEILKKK